MKSDWFGDSYDIVKRFFVGELRALGYTVYLDPMASGDWARIEPAFLSFLGVRHLCDAREPGSSALLLDPDTGIADHRSRLHISIASIVGHLAMHDIVLVFDQSFSRNADPREQIFAKLRQLRAQGAHGFYYDSHARFLFASSAADRLGLLRNALATVGLPGHRLIALDDEQPA